MRFPGFAQTPVRFRHRERIEPPQGRLDGLLPLLGQILQHLQIDEFAGLPEKKY
jgi:hypothetical protein